MLVLMRRIGEKLICIAGEDVKPGDRMEIIVTALDPGGRQANIGITAPQSIRICREEIDDSRPREPENNKK